MNESNYIKDVLQRLKDLGYKPLEQEYYKNIYTWLDWYKGYVPEFHDAKFYNGVKFVKTRVSSLGLAKTFAERWASLLFNDKTFISMKENDMDSQNVLDKALKDTNFRPQFRNNLEMVFALGTGATVEYKENDKTRINHIYAPMIFPLKQINGEIVSCAFASIDGEGYYLNIHEQQSDGSYIVKNDYFKTSTLKDKVSTEEIEKEGILKEYSTPVKLFQIYKPNQVNKIDLYCPMGMSVFANTIDQFKAADYAYDALVSEFRLGKKKIYVPLDTLKFKEVVDAEGNAEAVPIFDENQTEYYALPGENVEGKQIIEYNPQLRVQELLDGIQLATNLAGMNAGFGENYFTFKDGKVYTNTAQVMSSNSEMYKNIKKQEDMLTIGLVELAKALYFLETGTEYTEDVTIDFDDSIIEDTDTKRNAAILELNNGLIDNVQYYIDIYGMTEKQAVEFVQKIQQRKELYQPQDENQPRSPMEIDEADNEPLTPEEEPEEAETSPEEE